MAVPHDPTVLPTELPVPQDDGGARHLTGLQLPALALDATDGSHVELSKLAGRTVVYIYPRTGVPGQPSPEGWDAIPGARGCTPQSCSFRDHFAELKLTRAIKLPTFSIAGMTLLKRMALVIDDGKITRVFYPVFPPDKNAEEVIAWLKAN